MLTADTITDEQIRELARYAERIGDTRLATDCAGALLRTILESTRGLLRERCAAAYLRAVDTPEWAALDLPAKAFEVAEQIAQFVLEQAAEWDLARNGEQVHDALVDLARRIRVADWTPSARRGKR